VEDAASEKESEKLKKIYQASQINPVEAIPFQTSYRFLTVARQITDDPEKIFAILKRNSQLSEDMESKEYADLDSEAKAQLDHV
jgi:lysyl-tRNA synthetase class 1